jgi:hypothetical protein
MNDSRPLSVYLDSQDYSHLAKPPAGKAEFYRDLYAELDRLVSDGVIEIRYSAAMISEIAFTSEYAMKYAAERAQILKQLTRGKCLRFWSDILDDEIKHTQNPDHTVSYNRENDQWFDIDLDSIGGFADRLKRSVLDGLKEKVANRKARRKAGKADFVKLLTHTADGQKLLDGIVEKFNDKFPIEHELDKKTLAGYIAGSVGERQFQQYMRKLITDPVNLIARIAPEHDKQLKLPALVRNQGLTLINNVNPSIANASKFLSSFPPGDAFQQIRDDASALPAWIARDTRRKTIRRHLDEMPASIAIQHDISDSEIDRMPLPTFDVLLSAMTHHLKEAMAAAKARKPVRLFERSDAADLIHATYLPYVDVFRCDTAWVDRLKGFGVKFQTDVVGRIENLLPTIMHRLSQKTMQIQSIV